MQNETSNKPRVLSSIQKILKPHIWFSGCAIIRISSTWPCSGNLANAAVWKGLQILKNLQMPTWCQEGWKHKRVQSGRCLVGLEAPCVHLSAHKKKVQRIQVMACGLVVKGVFFFSSQKALLRFLFWLLICKGKNALIRGKWQLRHCKVGEL